MRVRGEVFRTGLRGEIFKTEVRGACTGMGMQGAGLSMERPGCGPVDGAKGIYGKNVFDVGEDELLVLLLVMDADFDDVGHILRCVEIRQEDLHLLVYMPPVLEDLTYGRP